MTKNIFQEKKMHIDGIQEIDQVEGYSITLQPADNLVNNKIYSYNEIKAL